MGVGRRIGGSRVLLWMAIAGLSAVAVVRVQAALVERREDRDEQQAASERRRAERAATSTEPSEAGPTELEWRPYDRGDCVTWDQSGGLVRTEVVDCADPHLIEIIESVEIPLGVDAPYPSRGEWELIFETHCRPLVVEHLGGSLDPFGRLSAGGIHPLERGWREGDRSFWCGVQASGDLTEGDEDVAEAITGRAAELDQSRLRPVGTCIEMLAAIIKVVPCDAPHHLVVVGHLDLSDLAERPSDEELRARCDAVAPAGDAAAGHTSSFVGFQHPSWDAGSRKGDCVHGEWDDVGQPILQAASAE